MLQETWLRRYAEYLESRRQLAEATKAAELSVQALQQAQLAWQSECRHHRVVSGLYRATDRHAFARSDLLIPSELRAKQCVLAFEVDCRACLDCQLISRSIRLVGFYQGGIRVSLPEKVTAQEHSTALIGTMSPLRVLDRLEESEHYALDLHNDTWIFSSGFWKSFSAIPEDTEAFGADGVGKHER